MNPLFLRIISIFPRISTISIVVNFLWNNLTTITWNNLTTITWNNLK